MYKPKKARILRQLRGQCVRCKAPSGGKYNCPRCRAKLNPIVKERMAKLKKGRREEGLCAECGREPVQGQWYCDKCKQMRREATTRRLGCEGGFR